ncbi:hypothetical protein X975_13131, partial [Stegodyphus mimosarum]
MLLRILLIILLISWLAESACPPPEKIYPFCTCREENKQSSMTCRNMQSFEDLLLPIQATVKRDMFSLHIINSSLLYIPNGLFQETNFKEEKSFAVSPRRFIRRYAKFPYLKAR